MGAAATLADLERLQAGLAMVDAVDIFEISLGSATAGQQQATAPIRDCRARCAASLREESV